MDGNDFPCVNLVETEDMALLNALLRCFCDVVGKTAWLVVLRTARVVGEGCKNDVSSTRDVFLARLLPKPKVILETSPVADNRLPLESSVELVATAQAPFKQEL